MTYKDEVEQASHQYEEHEERQKKINIKLWDHKTDDENESDRSLPSQFIPTEEAKILQWHEKQKAESVPFYFKKNDKESNDYITNIGIQFDDKALTSADKKKVVAANLCAATGTGSRLVGSNLLIHAAGALHGDKHKNITASLKETMDALIAMKPADIHEGMLCSRLWALHNQAMHYMAMAIAATTDAHPNSAEMYTNRATKLMRLHNETLETLNKYRRKGEQRVTVLHQNVQVNNGGQAVVAGRVTGGSGDLERKSEE